MTEHMIFDSGEVIRYYLHRFFPGIRGGAVIVISIVKIEASEVAG